MGAKLSDSYTRSSERSYHDGGLGPVHEMVEDKQLLDGKVFFLQVQKIKIAPGVEVNPA